MPDTAASRASVHESRIQWLDFLRCVAVMLVVWGHLFLVGINDPTTVGVWVPSVKGFLFGPDTIGNNPHGALGLVLALSFKIDVGSVGVGIFFLISGYVILRTIDRMTPLEFIIRRAVRIFPVLWGAIALTALVTYVFCAFFGFADPEDGRGVLAAGLASNGYFGGFSPIPVLWSLSAELVFYALFWAARVTCGRITLNVLLGLSLGCCLVACLPVLKISGPPGSTLSWHAVYFGELLVYVSYMLIGSAVYRLQQERRIVLIFYPVAIAMIWVISYSAYVAGVHRTLGVNMPGGAWALGVFLMLICAKPSGRWLRPFEWIAGISYPLYLVHIPLGWMALTLAAGLGAGMHLASLISLFVAILLAWVVHILVEQPSHSIGRRLGRRASAVAAQKG